LNDLLLNASDGFDGSGPQSRTSRFSIGVGRTAFSGVDRPRRMLVRPTSLFIPNTTCCIGLRQSASISNTRRPVCAMAIARLLAMVVLPSPDEGEVTRSVLLLRSGAP